MLGIGTTAGYVAQLLVQLPAMHRAGFRLRPVWDLHHPAVRRVAHLSTWLIGVVLANQVALALVMILAGKVQGGVTAYQFSYQFFQLPYALIVVSVASALMPDLSERWASGDRRGFERQFVAGLRVTLAVIIPVAFVYIAIAQPFIQLAVHHGRVTQSGAHLVSSSLALFAAGLPGFSAYFLLMRMYQAMSLGTSFDAQERGERADRRLLLGQGSRQGHRLPACLPPDDPCPRGAGASSGRSPQPRRFDGTQHSMSVLYS